MTKRADLWTTNEVAELRRLYAHYPAMEVARRLGRTLLAVKRKVVLLGLHRARARPVWTDAEKTLLTELHGMLACSEIGRRLGRSRGSVQKKAQEFGLRAPPHSMYWGGRVPPEVAELMYLNSRLKKAIASKDADLEEQNERRSKPSRGDAGAVE